MAIAFLLVDDDSDDLFLFREALKEVAPSVNCLTSIGGEEAFKILHNIKPDVIFLDINMPGMNGWDFLKKIKSENKLKDIHVIMYSTTSHDREIGIANQLGALGFLSKPADYKDLKKILKIIVEKMEDGQLEITCKQAKNLVSLVKEYLG